MLVNIPPAGNLGSRRRTSRVTHAPPTQGVRYLDPFEMLITMHNEMTPDDKRAAAGMPPAARMPTPAVDASSPVVAPATPATLLSGRVVPFGIAPRNSYPGYGRLRVHPGAFRASLLTRRVVLLVDHDQSRPLATTNGGLRVWETAAGLFAGVTDPHLAAEVKSLAAFKEMSPGFDPIVSTPGRDHLGPVLDIWEANLWEVSLVKTAYFSDHPERVHRPFTFFDQERTKS